MSSDLHVSEMKGIQKNLLKCLFLVSTKRQVLKNN